MSSLELLRNGYTPKRYGVISKDKRVLTFEELINRCLNKNKMEKKK
jgi:hypothetical protein